MGATAGAAWAVSGGGYSPSQQDCTANADRNNTAKGQVVPGCHNAAVNVESSNGTRLFEAGLDQLPTGYPGTPGLISLGYPGAPNAIHSGCLAFNTNGTGGGTGKGCGTGTGTGATVVFNTENPAANRITPELGAPDMTGLVSLLTSGIRLYYGQDDNTDAGEHDGVSGLHGTSGSINGPSDGGAIGLFFLPGAATTTPRRPTRCRSSAPSKASPRTASASKPPLNGRSSIRAAGQTRPSSAGPGRRRVATCTTTPPRRGGPTPATAATPIQKHPDRRVAADRP